MDEADDDAAAAIAPPPQRRRRRVLVAAGATVLAVLAATGVVRQCSQDAVEHETIGTFNVLPDPLPDGAPGTLIRSERLLGAPDGAIAWRVLYHSTDLDGTPIGVSGTVVAPDRPAPEGGWPIVSWAHPTTGATGTCAPSEGFDPFLLMAGLHELIDAGYAVAATDYPGMGADGPASYLIGVSEGNSVLDARGAARALPDAHAGADLFLWGHSQGGQAALFAAQQATAYAPELHVHGVAVAAPAADLGVLLDDHRDDVSGVTIGSYAFDSIEKVYGPKDPRVRLADVLTPAGVDVVPQIAPRCLLTDISALHAIAEPAIGDFFAVDPATTEPWKTILAENTPGNSPIGVPILVTQGDADELVRPSATVDFVARLCAAGEHVTFRTYAGIDHGLIGERTVPYLMTWLAEIRGGQPPASTCATGPDAEPPSSVP